MKKSISILLLFILLLNVFAFTVDAITGYSYYMTLTIQNTGGSDITQRLIVPVNALNLVNGGYMQADGDDSRLVYGGSEIDLTAMDLGHNAADWTTDILTVPAGGSKSLQIWTGNATATKNQVWCADDGDTNTAADVASLDITTDLTIDADVYVNSLPATKQFIVRKAGNYQVSVDNTNFYFEVWQNPDTEDLSPDGAGSATALTASAGANWQCVDDAPPLGAAGDGDFVYVPGGGGGPLTDYYTLVNTAIPAGSDIISVTVYFRGGKQAGANGTIQPHLKLGANITNGTPTAAPAGNANYSEVLARPGGGAWSQADLDSLEVGISLTTTDGFYMGCTQIYVSIGYWGTDGEFESHIAATAGTWTSLQCEYDGVNTSITDGTLSDSDALAGALNTTTYDLIVADFIGKLDDLVIADTAVDVLNLTFEPDEIDDTTIYDNSASSNDVTYSLAANPGDITLSLGTIQLSTVGSSTVSASGEPSSSVMGELSGETDIETFYTDEEVGGIMGTIIGSFSDASDVDDSYFWIGIYLVAVLVACIGSYALFKDWWITDAATGIAAAAVVAWTSPQQVLPWGIMALTVAGMTAWATIQSRKV